MARIIDSVLVHDDGTDQSTELDQRMPIAAVAREPRRLDREHGADAPLADRRQQALEARPRDDAARAAHIIVDDPDSGPAELPRAIDEPVAPAPALVIVHELISGRRTDVEVRAACKVLRCDLGHRQSPRLPALLRSRAAGLPPASPDRPSVWPPARCVAPPPRTGSVGAFRAGAALSASSVFDSDWRKPSSASISVRRNRRTSSEKRGASLSAY